MANTLQALHWHWFLRSVLETTAPPSYYYIVVPYVSFCFVFCFVMVAVLLFPFNMFQLTHDEAVQSRAGIMAGASVVSGTDWHGPWLVHLS